MGSGHRTVTVYFVAFAGLILAGLILFAPLPPWAWVVVAVVAGIVVVLAMRVPSRGTDSAPPVETTYLPPPPIEPREQRVVEVALPSMEDDYDFLFSATVRWSPDGRTVDEPVANLGGLAVDTILERAMDVTKNRLPGRASLVQHELNGALSRMQSDASGCVRAMAESVTLTLSDHDRQRLKKLAEVRKDKAVWEHERKYEQSKREYLGEDVLKDPGSTVVWWLAKNDDRVEKVVQDLGILAQLSSAANNEDIPECFRYLVPGPSPSQPADDEPSTPDPGHGSSAVDHFEAFLGATDFPDGDPQRALFTRQVADYLVKHGRQDAADDLERRFDAPSAFVPEDTIPPSDQLDEEPYTDDPG
ncbi:hypothetical protein OIE13_20310 [Streptosporangium sp. NBC_01810]|uniref:hypothetical protein n=1 Tax=Streptosporangium sp. NBC_01810 TaxID=2975951 RepID=UPI002DD90F53|nr:hypothetical protein [Streptosporangium sp. NBC_01810]WSA23316.1 hypothetical protein OIE13_20310 [Streptosporangium sp. NBC_01810]